MNKEFWRIRIDVGGTFTDCVALAPNGELRTTKVLSTGTIQAEVLEILSGRITVMPRTAHYLAEALRGGKLTFAGQDRRIKATDGDSLILDQQIDELSPGDPVSLSSAEPAPILAARFVTQTSVESPVPPCDFRLATTRATNALLERRHARVGLITSDGFADLLRIGDQTRPDVYAWPIRKPPPITNHTWTVPGRLGPTGVVVVPLDEDAVWRAALAARGAGVEAIAIALVNSWADQSQEDRCAEICREAGFQSVVTSSGLVPRLGLLKRASTAAFEAALDPVITEYIDSVRTRLDGSPLSILTSAGGLASPESLHPIDTLLSGPAGGVVGAAQVGRRAGFERVISFDMGGTSTDVARIDGNQELASSHRVGAFTIERPGTAIETVAAGGGSVCHVLDGRPRVGPKSAGASPGPACYGRGGPLTVTDVNLLLGRIDPASFGVPADVEAAKTAADELARKLGIIDRDIDPLLVGLLELANESMAEAIRSVSVRHGYDPADHALVAFGGAGPQHACEVAQRLNIQTVLVPPNASLLSAVGVHAARREVVREQELLISLAGNHSAIQSALNELEKKSRTELEAMGEAVAAITSTARLRCVGQESTVDVDAKPLESLSDRFADAYTRIHAVQPDRPVELVGLRVVGRGVAHDDMPRPADHEAESSLQASRLVHDGNSRRKSSVISREQANHNGAVYGPAIITEPMTQIWLPSGWRASPTADGSLRLDYVGTAIVSSDTPLAREILVRRLGAIAEQMGEALERAAVSVNVKDRRDYSCGVLDARGRLVSSAAHLPVHLGALGPCVRAVIKTLGPLEPGDAALTNHPAFGGSHLPDLTIVQPVVLATGERIGYVASRAHHAEVGGIAPGSMPVNAETLADEGVPIPPTIIARAGVPDTALIRGLFEGHRAPSRAVEDNVADLLAQINAGSRANSFLASLASERGVTQILDAMSWIIGHTSDVVGAYLASLPAEEATLIDTMDDGTSLAVRIRPEGSRLSIDFTGTGTAPKNNTNAPLAVTRSAVAYVIRLLVGHDVPLNEGFLERIDIVVPEGSILNPVFDHAPNRCPPVAGGNVETSQRVTDLLLRALHLAAGSSGTMNNTLLGNNRFSIYETVCSGAAATHDTPGVHAVHQHMTNTAISDPEVLEYRCPLRIRAFEIVSGSGGCGAQPGGCGIRRVFEALEPMTATMVTQRRAAGPPGAAGGGAGSPGAQWIRRGGETTPLAWADTAQLGPGDTLTVVTPGGGGWGEA
ncbi:MAG: hydantoinase B/oxoprolinase family protein [Planctomycetota bacterium]